MIEAEWLGHSIRMMLYILQDQQTYSERMFRLFAVACCRRIWQYIPDEVPKQIIEALERRADGEITNAEWESYCAAYEGPDHPSGAEVWVCSVIATCILDGGYRLLVDGAASCRGVVKAHSPARKGRKREQEEERAQCDLLRDIAGNPFRPVTFSPEWRTSTAITLATQMYESREFGAMPILADALQDAGCDNTDVLEHCRGPGPHVRGCWVADMVLGKE